MTDLVRYEAPPVSSLELAPQAWKLAEKIAGTDFVPAALRGKPEAVLACILAGHEAGVGPMQALAKIHIIEGRPAMAAELMRALVQRQGHELEYPEMSTTSVTAEGRRRGSERWTKVTWTMDDAKRGGLDGKQNWRKWPRAMLIARATAELCRLQFADVLAGISYTVEELEDSGDAPAGLVDFGPAEIVERAPDEVATRRTARAAKAITRQAAAPAEVDDKPEPPAGEIPDLPGGEIVDAEIVDQPTNEIVDGNIVDTAAAAAGPPGTAAAAEDTEQDKSPADSSSAAGSEAVENGHTDGQNEEDDWPTGDWPSGDFPPEQPPAGRRYTGPQLIAIRLAELYGWKGSSAEVRAKRLERISWILGRPVESSNDLTPDEIRAVLKNLDDEPAPPATTPETDDPAAIQAEPDPPTPEPSPPTEPPQATTAPPRTRSTPTPNPEDWSGDQWRELLAARKVKVTETMREAQRLGGLLEPAKQVATLDDVTGSGIAVDLLGWIEDLSLDRKAKP